MVPKHDCSQIETITQLKTSTELNNQFVKEKFESLEKKLDSVIVMIEGLDNKYASKSVEKYFIWLTTSVGAIVIGALMKLIIK